MNAGATPYNSTMAPGFRVLYDGWPLVYRPSSPAANHLWTILDLLPDEVMSVLALPGELPDWMKEPARTAWAQSPTTDTPQNRLRWEQRVLPQLAREVGADLLHVTHNHPPLRSGIPVAVSPTRPAGPERHQSLSARLQSALGEGGLARATILFWPADLPGSGISPSGTRLPPIVHPDFYASPSPVAAQLDSLDLPDSFILYHGSYQPQELYTLFEAWTWGAGALGDYYPLLLAGGLEPARRKSLEGLLTRYSFGTAVRLLPAIPPPTLPALFRKASALIQPGIEPPWGGSVRRALASGIPVVIIDHPHNTAIVGSAAFSIPASDPRGLGASLITVIVEEDVARKLSAAGRDLASNWDGGGFAPALIDGYRQALSGESIEGRQGNL